MAKILGLDLGTNSIGWALTDFQSNKIISQETRIFKNTDSSLSSHQCRGYKRIIRRRKLHAQAIYLSDSHSPSAIVFYTLRILETTKKHFPVFIHALLPLLFTGSLLMAILHQKDFQYWFNLAITILLGWIAVKKENSEKNNH